MNRAWLNHFLTIRLGLGMAQDMRDRALLSIGGNSSSWRNDQPVSPNQRDMSLPPSPVNCPLLHSRVRMPDDIQGQGFEPFPVNVTESARVEHPRFRSHIAQPERERPGNHITCITTFRIGTCWCRCRQPFRLFYIVGRGTRIFLSSSMPIGRPIPLFPYYISGVGWVGWDAYRMVGAPIPPIQ